MFDIILVFQFQSVLYLFDYVLISYNTDHSTLTNLAMTTFSYICNITDKDLADLMGLKLDLNGELINSLIQNNLELYTLLFQYTQLNSSQYPTLEMYVNYTCEELFPSLNESYIYIVSQLLEVDYSIGNIYICNSFDLLNVPNFNYLRGDIAERTTSVLNKQSKKDYTSIYQYTFDKELYTLYMLALMIFRPISKHFKDEILVPKLNTSFNFYVALVGVYLAVNIILEIILFIYVKWGISNNLSRIQKNLYLLNNCLN